MGVWRTLARIAGAGITAASLVFVAYSMFAHRHEMLSAFQISGFLGTVAVCVAIYAASLQLVAAGWYFLLNSVNSRLHFGTVVSIVARTQIYKYLPSNVLHLVGRFLLAKNAGASKQALSYAQTAELALMVVASATIALALSLKVVLAVADRHGVEAFWIVPAYIAIAIAALGVIPVLGKTFMRGVKSRHAFAGISAATACYLVFFLVNGWLLIAITGSMEEVRNAQAIVGIAAFGWLLGFVVPGAPGGLGVREMVFIVGFTSIGYSPVTAASAAVGHRIVTLGGDSLLALAELSIRGARRR